MDEAFVEYAKDHVEHCNGCEDQNEFVCHSLAVELSRALEGAYDCIGYAHLDGLFLYDALCIGERVACCQVEGNGDCRKLSLMGHGKRAEASAYLGYTCKGHKAITAWQAHNFKLRGRLPPLVTKAQDHLVLILVLVDGADLTLPIGQAQGIVKGTHGDAETRHGIAVGVEHGLKAPLLEIRVHVLDDGVVRKGLHKLAAPCAQLPYVVSLQGILVLASGRTASHLQVLGRLQKNLNTRLTHKSWP